ncbi:MAG TPA: nucleotidyltransferase domain-containing protein [Roseiflexaceae bacterium]|nr:nucleotidyltransferase domain-containing protein [Roseiflexaceae bacterium]
MNPIAQQFVEELQADPGVVGIVLFGSWARGNNRPDSDVDLLVIVEQGFKRTVEYRAGQAIEITYTTQQGAIDYWQANPDEAVELWNIARVLYDRDGTVARLRRAGDAIKANGKAPLEANQYEHAKFDAHDQLKAVEGLASSDPATASMLLSAKVLHLAELFYDTRQLWTPPPKQRLASIKDLDPDLYNLFSKYYEQYSLPERIAIVRSIIAAVFDAVERC